MKTVKKDRKIIGFVFESKGTFWYAFGKPSQDSYISFECKSEEDGINKINELL